MHKNPSLNVNRRQSIGDMIELGRNAEATRLPD
jgi:hypothetical protein